MVPRLFMSVALNKGVICALSAAQHHYLLHVLRRKDGDMVEIFNGCDGLWLGQLVKGFLYVQEQVCVQPVPRAPRRLAYSPIKQQDWLIQKAVELGVTHFQPIWCDRTVVRHEKSDRLEKIVIEACEQCKRLDVPMMLPAVTLKDCWNSQKEMHDDHLFSALRNNGGGVVLDPQASSHITDMAQRPEWILVGPEGGWSPEELNHFDQHAGVRRCHVGSRILRAETAALVAATFLDWFPET
jgi:16S rRNA (uracil1498-N3)-methyltransferase